jgi:hypothetical protein
MHRSGTSMIASALHACGLDLGPKKDFLPPDPNNPEGFWESRSFLRLNDAILKGRGGSWDHPPRRDVAGWENEPSLDPACHKASKLVRNFQGREPWGWKDPRNCLTLSWWRKLLPDMKVLICVRNPLAVAKSLWLRNEISYADSFELWLTYNRRVLSAAPLERRLVTHCETYLRDPQGELRRVLQWAGLAATEDRMKLAYRRIAPSLMHHHMTLTDLVDAGASADLLRCYRDLCEEAGLGESAELAGDVSAARSATLI